MTDDLPNHIIDHIYVGSKIHAKNRDGLQSLQITHILNVTQTKNVDPIAGVANYFEKDKSFIYRRCAIYDNKAEDITNVLEGCIAFIVQAKFYGRILVHCSKGISRSVSMIIAYLIKEHEMSYDDALQLVQRKRAMAQPNPSFEEQLRMYDARMRRLRQRKQHNSRKSTLSIGPQLPPHLSSKTMVHVLHKGEYSKDNETVIGPEMPPNLKRKTVSDIQDNTESNLSESSKRTRVQSPL